MNASIDKSTILDWAEKNFGTVQLFDKRRKKRLITIAERLGENKGSSLARLFDDWYDVKATYNLLRLNLMTPKTIQSTHRNLAYEDMLNWPKDVLAIEDSSDLCNGLFSAYRSDRKLKIFILNRFCPLCR